MQIPNQDMSDWSEEDKTLYDDLVMSNSYIAVRRLPDGSFAAIGSLIFTTAIYMDLTLFGYGRRFCYAKPTDAIREFLALKDECTEPTGWLARR